MTLETALQNPAEFEKLFREYYPQLALYATKIIGDLDTGKEMAQRVFVNLYEKRAHLKVKTSTKNYLFRATKNACINYQKQQQMHSKHTEILKISTPTSSHPDEEQETSQLEVRIHQAIENLPDRCRQIFKMNRFEGMKNKEIAESLGISLRTVETQISKALKTLRKLPLKP